MDEQLLKKVKDWAMKITLQPLFVTNYKADSSIGEDYYARWEKDGVVVTLTVERKQE